MRVSFAYISRGTLYLMATMFGGTEQIAAARMAPQGDADIHLLADMPVIVVERVVLAFQKMQDRRVDDDVVGADCFGMSGEFDDYVHVLIGTRHDGAEFRRFRFVDGDLEGALALGQRH
jgi:hypothetical protein